MGFWGVSQFLGLERFVNDDVDVEAARQGGEFKGLNDETHDVLEKARKQGRGLKHHGR